LPPLISIENVNYVYHGAGGEAISALQDISLEIEAGELVAVIGANGSGKTTLARLLGALLVPTSGSIHVAGLDTSDKSVWSELHQAVGMVFQNPEDQVIATIVEEDVAFGLENLGLPPPEIRQRVRVTLEEVGLYDERMRPPHLLSAGQLQRLALAGVIAMRPRCVIFDEATTMIDPVGRRVAMDSMRRLHGQGVTIIFITHFMEEAVNAERVLLLQKGRIMMDGSPADIFQDPARLAEAGLELPIAGAVANDLRSSIPDLPSGILTVEALVRSILAIWTQRGGGQQQVLPPNSRLQTLVSKLPAHPLVEVTGLGHIYLKGTPLERQALEGVSLQVGEGASHGLAGITGSGKSTLLQHLNGLLRPQVGSVRVGPFDLNDSKVKIKSVIQLAGLVFQNPELQFFEQYVGDEIAYGPRQMGLKEALSERVRWAMEMVGLDFIEFKDRLIFSLSGGERRKVALASTLALKPSLLLMDEPTAGLDPQSRRDLLQKLNALRVAGMTFVLSSHQMEVLSALADDLTIFSHGKNVYTAPVREAFDHPDTLSVFGLEPPQVYQAAYGLRKQGFPLPPGTYGDAPTLARSIKDILK
jgi:energy-coupling factor transport system ATP-binding protein